MGKTSKIVIALMVPLDLAHNTPVTIKANETIFQGVVDRTWLSQAYTQGGSRNSAPCTQCRNPNSTSKSVLVL